MSTATRRTDAATTQRHERRHAWLAALLTASWHLALLLIAMFSPPITVTTPQGTAAGSPMVVDVDYLGDAPPPPSPPPAAASPPAASRLQTTPSLRADDPLPPHAVVAPEAPAPSRAPRPAQRTATPTPPAPPSRPRRARTWGQPPGLMPRDTAPVNAGTAQGPATEPGRRYEASTSGPNLEVGGYQVIYDLRSETRARTWREQGMAEVFLPLPGTRQLMVCPLETAIRRESGPCRLLDPDDPAMADIGDAREVLNMMQVYRRGELVWRGPGPYR